MKRFYLAICCLAMLAVRLGADELRSVPFYRFGIASDNIGYSNLILADITGDTRPEIISCVLGAPLALGYSAGTYVPVWHGPNVSCTGVAAGDANGDGATEVIVATSTWPPADGGEVMLFDPRGFGAARRTVTLPGTEEATDVAFGNVDFDGEPEIVVTTEDATYVYDARTMALQWSANGHGGMAVKIADIDGDARLEIVVSTESFGAVLDGGNQVVKWGYVGGFGNTLSVGNVDADAKAEIVFAEDDGSSYTDLVILNGDFTTIRRPFTGMPLGIGDANGDGLNEVMIGAGFGLQGQRPADGAVLWTHPLGDGIFGTASVGDVDGDGQPEVVYGTGISSTRDYLVVADVVSHTTEHQSLDLDVELHSATGDVDGDGRPDLVIASTATDSGYHGGIVQIVDPRTHALKGLLSATGLTFYDIHDIAIGQLDGDPALEIVALGIDSSSPMIVVWDAATRQIQYQSAHASFSSPQFLSYSGMAVANIDGDAVDEIILGMSDGNLVVLNGATPVIQSFKPLSGQLVSLELADVDDDGTLDAVAGTTTTLYLLDTADWSVMKETPLTGIRAVAATSEGGGRVAVTFDDQAAKLRLYDLQLTPFWTCTAWNGSNQEAPLKFVDAGNETRLLAGVYNRLLMFPIAGGAACPASSTIDYARSRIHDLHSADVTGDGRSELVVDTWNAVDVNLIGLSTELRGDTDGDGSIGAPDIDALADTLFGATPGIRPMADVNADQRISPEDVFALIHYEYGGGPEPQP